jgi:hypothetical protein
MAVPDSSPRASAGVSVRIPQMLTLADGTFFPPGCCAITWGCASGSAGLAHEALEECVYSFKVFFTASSLCEVLISAGLGGVSAGLGGVIRMCRRSRAFGAYPRGVATRRAPEPGPVRGDRGGLSDLFVRPFVVPLRDRGVRCPQLPSSGSQIAGSSSSCYRVIQVDAHACSIRVGSWSRDLSMKALTRVW